jgi:hypothetical protein
MSNTEILNFLSSIDTSKDLRVLDKVLYSKLIYILEYLENESRIGLVSALVRLRQNKFSHLDSLIKASFGRDETGTLFREIFCVILTEIQDHQKDFLCDSRHARIQNGNFLQNLQLINYLLLQFDTSYSETLLYIYKHNPNSQSIKILEHFIEQCNDKKMIEFAKKILNDTKIFLPDSRIV